MQGKTLHLSERDRHEMRELLLARGYSAIPVGLKTMSRSDRLATATPNEKAGGGSIKTGRVSIKALGGKTLDICGQNLALPDDCQTGADSSVPLATMPLCWSRIMRSSTRSTSCASS